MKHLKNTDNRKHIFDKMSSSLWCALIFELENMSEEVLLHHSLFNIFNFKFLLSMWCDWTEVTCKSYKPLQEVLKSFFNLNDLKRLSMKLNTFKQQCQQQLPSLKLQHKQINVSSLKLLSLPVSQKTFTITQIKLFKDFIYFLNLKKLFQCVLSFKDFKKHLHFDITEFVNNLTELWHSLSWDFSIQMCFKEYAYYFNNQLIFSSDIVYFLCHSHLCSCCTVQKFHCD